MQAGAEKNKDPIAEWLRFTAELLCDPGEAIRVVTTQVDHANLTIYALQAGRPGALIGKGGETISALRKVADKMGRREGRQITVNAEEIPHA